MTLDPVSYWTSDMLVTTYFDEEFAVVTNNIILN